MTDLNQEEWLEKLEKQDDSLILDVRTPSEWDEGIIDGAKKVNFMDTEKFIEFVDQLDKEKSYFVYCRSGNRSGQVCQYMESKGFNNAYNLKGGVLEYDGELVS